MMTIVDKTIEVDRPIRAVYDQWTHFESFPEFMKGVEEVRRIGDNRVRWRAIIAGKEEEWEAEIIEELPETRIAWESVTGARNRGVISFLKIEEEKTQIILHVEYEPDGILEVAGNMFRVLDRHLESDLKRFKRFVESYEWETRVMARRAQAMAD